MGERQGEAQFGSEESQTQGRGGRVGTHPLLLGEVEGGGGLDGLDLLGLALVHDLAGEALGSKLLVEAGNLLVEGLQGGSGASGFGEPSAGVR